MRKTTVTCDIFGREIILDPMNFSQKITIDKVHLMIEEAKLILGDDAS